MDIDQLRAFIAVCDTGSFSLAADRLYLTQPAVSKRISALEAQLGTSLLNRVGRSILANENGERLLQHARAILDQIEVAERDIRLGSATVSGQLSIITSHHIGLHRLPKILRTFIEAYPNVKLDIQFKDSEVAHSTIQHGDAELAVVTLAPLPNTLISSHVIWPDPLVFVANSEHPLAGQFDISLATLSHYPAVIAGFNTYTGQIIKQLFREQGLRLDTRTMSTNYLETIKMLVSIGVGWSVLPRSMLDKTLVGLNVTTPVPARKLGCIYHAKRQLSSAALAFRDALQAEARHLWLQDR